jgi:phage-related protein
MYLLWYTPVVEREQPIRVVFFRTETGSEPVRKWLKDLAKDEKKIIGEDIKTVQFSWPIGKPLVDNLGEQIWEVRSRLKGRIARTLFTVQQQEIVLLHGFIKKERKTPVEDLRLAKKRKSLYMSGYE